MDAPLPRMRRVDKFYNMASKSSASAGPVCALPGFPMALSFVFRTFYFAFLHCLITFQCLYHTFLLLFSRLSLVRN